MPEIRVLNVGGTPFEMGYQHGLAFARDIRKLARERIELASRETWSGRQLPRGEILNLAAQIVDHHGRYSASLHEELEGMAAATGLSLPELVIANGFTDFVDVVYNADRQTAAVPTLYGNECTTFMANSNSKIAEHGLIGQTWDMHATATPHVILLNGKPKDAPEFLLFTLTGCVGMIGMNSAGISLAINNLESADGKPGVTWNFVVREVLAQDNLDAALACITSAELAGAHNYMLMDASGRGFNVEAMPSVKHVQAITDNTYAHANVCLSDEARAYEREQPEDLLIDSETRASRANQLLEDLRPITPDDLMAISRDRSDGSYSICSMPEPPHYWETCGAVVMRPATREFWGVWGLPTHNEYQRFALPAD